MACMTFKELFEEKTSQYQDLCSDCEDLESFMNELHTTTKGKSFTIQNPVAWRSIISFRNQLFINIVEWIDLMSLGEGNFLNNVRAHYLSNVKISLTKKQRQNIKPLTRNSSVDELIVERRQNYLDDLLTNFFGSCKQVPRTHQKRLCNCDIETLKEKFKVIRDRLACARHMYAHPYNNIANVNNISLKDVRVSLDQIKEYLGIISSVSNIGVALDAPTRTYCLKSESLAREFVDLILCGSIKQMPFVAQNIETPYHIDLEDARRSFYDKLHSFHENQIARDSNYSKPFNDHETMYFQFSKIHNGLFGKIEEGEF